MADEDRNDGPSLELPSFSLRRRKRKKAPATDTEADPAPQQATAEPAPEPASAPEPEPASTPAPRPATEPEPEPEPEPSRQPEPAATPATAERPAFVETSTAATAVAAEEDRAAAEPATRETKPRRPLRVGLGAVPGAILTGVIVGLVTVGLTWGALEACEVVRGASSCGGTGLFVLLLILVAMIFLGAALLRLFGVADPGSTSFLAIGLLAVVALLFLVDLLFNWWMIIVIPCVTLLTYTLSSWVTTSFADSDQV